MRKRLKQLNSSETVPFAFRLYAYYEVEERLVDFLVHNLIDNINNELRTSEIYNGKKRVREFYALEPERVYSILETIAQIKGDSEYFYKVKETNKEREEIEEIHNTNRSKLPRLDWMLKQCLVNIGDESCVINYPKEVATIYDDKNVLYNGEVITLNQY